jgi:hypothetical protein
MNKFAEFNNTIYEIRPDRQWRWFAALKPIDLYHGEWCEDDPIGHQDSWESMIEDGLAKFIDLEKWMEENFENLL